MKKSLYWVLIILAVTALVACGGPTKTVRRTSVDEVTDLSGRWNDTDSRLVAEQIIKDVLARPWLPDYKEANAGKKPVVIVGSVENNSSEHIKTDPFVKDIERELINSGRVRFVANKSERKGVREERMDQQTNAREETAKRLAAETGADFMLIGNISSYTDAIEGRSIKYYQIDMELINLESNEKVWIGTKKIKKDIAQSKTGW